MTEFENHFIHCELTDLGAPGWSVKVSIFDGERAPVNFPWPHAFLERRYASREVAYVAGLKAGKNAVHGLLPDEEFI